MTNSWPDERTARLTELWSQGLSASQIAGRLGGITRNGVIGKVHRLGLSGRATTSRMKSHRTRSRRGTTTRFRSPRSGSIGNPIVRALYRSDATPYNAPTQELVIPLPERKTVQTLTECTCRWPIGDPFLPDFHFCGKTKVPGLPYCEFHARRAFQPPAHDRRERSVTHSTMPAIAAPAAADHLPTALQQLLAPND